MKKIACLILIYIPKLIFAQPSPKNSLDKGIKFEQGQTWQEIRSKAKTESKYIFIDYYATWCGPCKAMDKYVYSNDSIGNYIDSTFISVKVQMDTSINDNEDIKKWYGDAHALQQQYKITSLPTYLFFSPDGRIVHRDLGYKKVAEFRKMASDASSPKKQYYTLLGDYLKGYKDYGVMPFLANSAKRFNETELADSIARDYIKNYLLTLQETELYTRQNIGFIASFYQLLNSKEKSFELFYRHAERINAVMQDEYYSVQRVDYVINKEEIEPVITAGKNQGFAPDWKGIKKAIKRKYDLEYAERNVIAAKVRWYYYKKEWSTYAKYLVDQIEKYGVHAQQGLMASFYLNNDAFMVFKYSNNSQELRKALSWVERAMQMESHPSGSMMDTKANLLYKLGRRKEAVSLEEKAVKLASKDEEIQKAFEKMKNGEPTWPKG